MRRRRAPAPPDPIARRRYPRRLDLFATVPEDRTADALDDERAAQRLIHDLVALVDAGLISPVDDDGEIRYTASIPDDLIA